MQVVTYHGRAIGFIAMTLKTVKTKNSVGKVKMLENGIMTGGAYMLQAFLGLGTSILIPVCSIVSILFAYLLFKKGGQLFKKK